MSRAPRTPRIWLSAIAIALVVGLALGAQASAEGGNADPRIADHASTFTVTEDAAAGTAVGDPFSATDPDGDPIRWSLSDGQDPALFRIDANGQVRLQAGLDYESVTSYTITVTAADGQGGSDTAAITISVSNVYEPARIQGPSLIYLKESAQTYDRPLDGQGQAARWRVEPDAATTRATDQWLWPLSGSPLTGIVEHQNWRRLYAIVGDRAELDYELQASYAITLTYSDLSQGELISDQHEVELLIENVYEPPVIVGGGHTLWLDEDAAAGTALGAPFTAVLDADADGTVSWSLSGSDDFTLDSAGQLTVAAGATLDYETEPSYTLTLTATDSTSNPNHSGSVTVTVNLIGPLGLSLTSSRALCTANTLTELSWEIAGGQPPYTLTVAGETVDPAAESVRVNCGPLTLDPLSGDPLPNQTKAFNATVTDAQTPAASTQASVSVELAEALAAPAATARFLVDDDEMTVIWSGHTSAMCQTAGCFGYRWRALGSAEWSYEAYGFLNERDSGIYLKGLREGVAYEAAIAAIRALIELETPQALNWAVPVQATTLTAISGLTTSATHDTVTVRWDRQPSAVGWGVWIVDQRTGAGDTFDVVQHKPDTWGNPASGYHEVTFSHLPSDTDYDVAVFGNWAGHDPYDDPVAAVAEVRTKPLPAEAQELPRGPQNLRATSTHDSITVYWDEPFSGANNWYIVRLHHPLYGQEGHTRYQPFKSMQHTWTGLSPEVEYLVHVEHAGIVWVSAELKVKTKAAPSEPVGGISASAVTAATQAPGWPLGGVFNPFWPHLLRSATGWSLFTDDPWVQRGSNWHAGIDTGHSDPAYTQRLQALADGRLYLQTLKQAPDPEESRFILFCPGISGTNHHANDVYLSDHESESVTKDGTDYDCIEIANPYHGRVAVTLHEYADDFYIVLYAHLDKFAPTLPFGTSQSVTAGTYIGDEGGSGICGQSRYEEGLCSNLNEFDDLAYAGHLHMTIRHFPRSVDQEAIESVKGETWRKLRIKEPRTGTLIKNPIWQCGTVDVPTYCDPPRRIPTMVDPETVLPPAPPAATFTTVPGGAPAYDNNNSNHVRHESVDNIYKRFVLADIEQSALSVPPPTPGPIQLPVLAYIDVAVGRPEFYTYFDTATQRQQAGVAGTADGVLGYFVDGSYCQATWSASVWQENSRDGQIGFTESNAYWSEVEPLRLGVPIERGRSCEITVRSYNVAYQPGEAVPAGAYGRKPDGTVVEPPFPIATVHVYQDRLEPNTVVKTVAGANLQEFEFDIYVLQLQPAHDYRFETEVGDTDDVTLSVWFNGERVKVLGWRNDVPILTDERHEPVEEADGPGDVRIE